MASWRMLANWSAIANVLGEGVQPLLPVRPHRRALGFRQAVVPEPQGGPGSLNGQVHLDQAWFKVHVVMPGQAQLLERMKAPDHSGGTVSTVIRLALVTQ